MARIDVINRDLFAVKDLAIGVFRLITNNDQIRL